MKNPLISIIVPTYNREKTITTCIDNLLEQDFNNYEIIVVDDGSTDKTQEILSTYTDKITYVYQTNSGAGAARNKGLEHARGDWIAYQDSDDIWERNKLRLQVSLLEQYPDIDIISNNLSIYREHIGETVNWFQFIGLFPSLGKYVEILDDPLSEHITKRFAWLQASLIRKCVLNNIGGSDTSLKVFIDYDLFLRLATECKWLVDNNIVAHILREDNDTTSISSRRKKDPTLGYKMMIKIYIKLKESISNNKHLSLINNYLSNSYNSLANEEYEAGRKRNAISYYIKAFRQHKKIILLFKIILCFIPMKLRLKK